MDIPKGESKREPLSLLPILMVSLGLRLFTWRFPFLPEFDSSVHYAVARHVAETGGFPFYWPLSNYPRGAIISEPMGLYYLSVSLYWMLKPIGASFIQAFKLATPLLGTLSLLPLYLFARETTSKRAALFSTAILAFLPAFIFRTSAGFYRGDAFSLLFMVTGLFLFLRGLGREGKDALLYYCLAGASFGAMALVWQGFVFGVVVLSAFVAVYSVVEYLNGRGMRRVLWGYAVSAGLCVAVVRYSLLVQPTSYASFFVKDLSYLCAGAAVFLLSLEALGRTVKRRRLLVLVLLGVLLSGLALRFVPGIGGRLSTGYGLVKATDPVTRTIVELQPPTLEVMWEQYSLLVPLSLFGTLVLAAGLWRRSSAEGLLLLVWILASGYLIFNAGRFLFLASMPLAVAGGLFLERLESHICSMRQKKEAAARGAVLLLLIPIAASGVSFAGGLEPHMSDDWYATLQFLSARERGAVLCWWDYGSWIQGLTGFPTTLDTVHGQHISDMREIAGVLLEKDQSRTLEGLRRYHVRYVAMPSEMVFQMQNFNAILNVTPPRPDYVSFEYVGTADIDGVRTDVYGKSADKRLLVSGTKEGKVLTYLEAGKAYSIRKVYYWEERGLMLRDYSGSSFPIIEGEAFLTKDRALYVSPRMAGTLLNSLTLLNGYGFDAYELIYANPGVRLYEVRYNHTWAEVSTNKNVFREGETLEVKAKIDSTVPFEGNLTVEVYRPVNGTSVFYAREEAAVAEGGSCDLSFYLNESFSPGGYHLYAVLSDSERQWVETLWRPFWVR